MEGWACKKCGACCRSFIVERLMPDYWDKDDKKCKYINNDNLCEIYDKRPEICVVQEGTPEDLLSSCCDKLRTVVYGR